MIISHACKTIESLESILESGEILAPSLLGKHVPRFNALSDDFVGRASWVMFCLGYGYIKDNANMVGAFVFDSDILSQVGWRLHREPVLFWLCGEICRCARQLNRDLWVEFFRTHDDIQCYDNQFCSTTFRDYMLHFLEADRPRLDYGDVWGASAFASGLIEVVYRSDSATAQLVDRKWEEWRFRNELDGGQVAIDTLRKFWWSKSIYREWDLSEIPLADRNAPQILIGDKLGVWSTQLREVILRGHGRALEGLTRRHINDRYQAETTKPRLRLVGH